MENIFGDIRHNAGGKRAPVVFCLDVTGSMTTPMKMGSDVDRNRMDMANEMIRQFFAHIISIVKAADAVEVAFVLFTHDIVMETDFVNIMHVTEDMFRGARKTENCGPCEVFPVTVQIQGSTKERTGQVPKFTVSVRDKGTKLDTAVLNSYRKILDRKAFHLQSGTQFYAPHFILITDGDPNDGRLRLRDDEETHIKAVNMVNDHSYTGRDGANLIVPITVGIFGDKQDPDAERRVLDYAQNFPNGYFNVRDNNAVNDFKKAAEFLCATVIKSLSLPVTTREDRMGGTDGKHFGRSIREIYGQ